MPLLKEEFRRAYVVEGQVWFSNGSDLRESGL
jgi:hypothetical protein